MSVKRPKESAFLAQGAAAAARRESVEFLPMCECRALPYPHRHNALEARRFRAESSVVVKERFGFSPWVEGHGTSQMHILAEARRDAA